MSRIALLADVHGNSIALDAVLKDIEQNGSVDAYWLLGDYAAIGFDPVGVLERLERLPNYRAICGNTELYLLDFSVPPPSIEELQENPDLLEVVIHTARSFGWTSGAVTATGWLPWIENLPLEMRESLPDGTRALAVHASPGTAEGTGITPKTPEHTLEELLRGAEADLVLVGHTHIPFERWSGNIQIVNPGSVSNSFLADKRASYAVLEAGKDGYQVNFHRVEYDIQATIEATKAAKHPAQDFIERLLREG